MSYIIYISFCIASILNYLLGEFHIKKYNKLLKELDEEK